MICQICHDYSTGPACTSPYCGGNVARFELAKLRLGRVITYRNAADRVPSHWSTRILMAMYQRLGGQVPKPIRDWAWAESGYCLDAPEEMPAGGCYSLFVVDDEDLGELWAPAQLTTRRE